MASLDDVYRKFGEASEAAQLLETELGTVLLVIEVTDAGLLRRDAPEEAGEILRRINRSTLGQVLRIINNQAGIAGRGSDLFAEALAERNRLSHSFFRQHNFRRNSPEGRAAMLEDLETIHSTLLEAYKMALMISGIDLDAVRLPELPTRHLNID